MAIRTINPAEINQFKAIAHEWWDHKGKFRLLHDMTPLRIEYIKNCVGALSELTVLDVGCGGGLTAEPLTRLGAKVTGLDAEKNTIEIAKTHAEAMELDITYLNKSIEEHAESGVLYDVVLALEIIEHVDNVQLFCEHLKSMLKPGGTLILSTMNRTAMSYAKAILAAEYVLRWVPRGTHDWDKFMKPSEMVNHFEKLGLKLHSMQGLGYNPLTRNWRFTDDLSVNYFACFRR